MLFMDYLGGRGLGEMIRILSLLQPLPDVGQLMLLPLPEVGQMYTYRFFVEILTIKLCFLKYKLKLFKDLMGKQLWLHVEETLNRMLSLFMMTKNCDLIQDQRETGYSVSCIVLIIFTTMTGHQTSFDTTNNWQK